MCPIPVSEIEPFDCTVVWLGRSVLSFPPALLVNILDVIACIKERQDALRRTTRHVLTRVAKCTDVGRRISEHLL
jgi:hypothetical protein